MKPILEYSGVYAIRNTVNNKRYVGSAAYFANRWRVHKKHLRDGKHHSKYLQHAWNKYGEDAFVFEPMLICAPDHCLAYEQLIIDALRCADGKSGYNCSPTAGSPRGVKRSAETRAKIGALSRTRKMSDENKRKLSERMKGVRRTPEEMAKAVATRRANGTKMPKWTEERKKKFSEMMRGRKLSAETIAKIANANRGKKRSPEFVARMAALKRGKKQSAETIAKRVAAMTGKKRGPHSAEHRAALCLAWKTRRKRMPAKGQMAFI